MNKNGVELRQVLSEIVMDLETDLEVIDRSIELFDEFCKQRLYRGRPISVVLWGAVFYAIQENPKTPPISPRIFNQIVSEILKKYPKRKCKKGKYATDVVIHGNHYCISPVSPRRIARLYRLIKKETHKEILSAYSKLPILVRYFCSKNKVNSEASRYAIELSRKIVEEKSIRTLSRSTTLAAGCIYLGFCINRESISVKEIAKMCFTGEEGVKRSLFIIIDKLNLWQEIKGKIPLLKSTFRYRGQKIY
ncbi:hypothetical protein J7K24_01470 [bacterium]|nr:hypothetical protein [bacterium]